jgi:hypothetical protein
LYGIARAVEVGGIRTPENHRYAVVTGDVVGYTALHEDKRAGLLDTLRYAHSRVRGHYTERMSATLDVFRGDSWQFVLAAPDQSLRAALLFRATMISRSLDTRLAIGIGTVDVLPSDRVPTGDGEAFRISGKALDGMGRDERMIVRAQGPIGSMEPATLDVLVALMDALVSTWTPGQAAAVAGALVGLSQKTIASEWEGGAIRQQAVAQHQNRARWNTIARALEHFEAQFGERGAK